MKTMGVIIACGKEEEIGAGNEVAFLTLGNSPTLVHSLKAFEMSPVIDGIIVAVAKERVDATIHAIKRYGCSKIRGVVVGGVNRLSTLKIVDSKLPETPSVVVVHEASRPFVQKQVIAESVKAAKRYGCAIAAHKMPDAAKVSPKGMKVDQTLKRNTVWCAQTPQAFKYEVLKKIIDPKNKNHKIVDDESEFVTKPAEVYMVEDGECNMKIRSSKDLAIATALLNAHLI